MDDTGILFAYSFAIFLILIPIAMERVKYYRDIDAKTLATKDPFLSNIYGLAIFGLLAMTALDLMLVVIQVMIWLIFDPNVSNGLFSVLFNIVEDNWYFSHEWSGLYILIDSMNLWGISWIFRHEIKINRALKNARTDMLWKRVSDGDDTEVDTPSNVPIYSAPIERKSDEPATFAAVLQAMDLQLKQAVQAAEDLKSELHETKEKVVTLEIEVQEKDSEITQIKESKSHFDDMISESSESDEENDGKSLSLTDSVMVGDSIMGGVKIDKQINNDPEAIARAVIDAYRMGKSDSD